MSTIDQKSRYLDVIAAFADFCDLKLTYAKTYELDEPKNEIIASLRTKLSMQRRTREKQEELKVQTVRTNSSVHLGLKLINEALGVTARKNLNYDTVRLQQRGTTATHIVFSCVS